MSASHTKIVQVDTDHIPAYNSADLTHFQQILDDIVEELKGGDADPEGRELVKIRLAAAIFECAAGGERDAARLRQHAITAVLGIDDRPQAKSG